MRERGSVLVWLAIAIVLVLVGTGVYFLYRGKALGEQTEVSFVTKLPLASSKECLQVVTYGKNSDGECRQFATSCEVPDGWTSVEACEIKADTTNWQNYSPSSRAFEFKYPEGWATTARQTTVTALKGERLITQVQFDQNDKSRRDPQGFLYGRVELSWIGSPSFNDIALEDFAKDFFAKGNPSLEVKKYGDLDVIKVSHSMCPANSGCIDYVVKHGPYFYDLRILKQPVSGEDLSIAEGMLNTWVFSK